MEKFKNHRFAKVKPEFQHQEIKWVRMVIRNNGIGVLLYDDINSRCLYDDWYETLELAKEGVNRVYGIEDSDWKTAEDIIKLGFEITDES